MPIKKRPKAPELPFNVEEHITESVGRLWLPKPEHWIDRPENIRGLAIARFALPLHLCPTSNATSRKIPAWCHAKRKAEVVKMMDDQWLLQKKNCPHVTLPLWYPQVLAVRFAVGSCDACSDFAKAAIDCLQPFARKRVTVGKKIRYIEVPRIGLIPNDDPKSIELHQWWEPVVTKAEECVYIEVRS